jgi:hypothetical protein
MKPYYDNDKDYIEIQMNVDGKEKETKENKMEVDEVKTENKIVDDKNEPTQMIIDILP